MTSFKLLALAFISTTTFPPASPADAPQVNANEVIWTKPPQHYSGSEFAEAFRYRTLVGGLSAPIQGMNVYFGEAELAPGAIYVGHKHESPEIYYVISGEAEWTVDGNTFKATAGTTIYAKPYAVHRMVNVSDEILKTVWMWWGEPQVLNQYPELVEPVEDQPANSKFED